ncbi:MAG: hypothetical protein RIQ79_713 [Verrucomicrobiota bacterium]|jgi:hypothetical protein
MSDSHLKFTLQGDGLARVLETMGKLADGAAAKAGARAVNHTGEKASTAAVKALTRQIGLKPRAGAQLLKKRLRTYPASAGKPSFELVTFSGALPMGEFAPTQLSKGWAFKPWNDSKGAHQFARAFTVRKWQGAYLMRVGKERFPLKRLRGPSVKKELIKDAPPLGFEAVVTRDLPARVEHEARRIAPDVFT